MLTVGDLSSTMLDIIGKLAEGESLPQIAIDLRLSEDDVDVIVAAAAKVLRARNRVHVVNIALRRRLI